MDNLVTLLWYKIARTKIKKKKKKQKSEKGNPFQHKNEYLESIFYQHNSKPKEQRGEEVKNIYLV